VGETMMPKLCAAAVFSLLVLHAQDSPEATAPPVLLPGILRVMSQPSEANVYINGQCAGQTPFQDEMNPGDYTLTVGKELYESDSDTAAVLSGKVVLKSFVLKPKYGIIDVNTAPESEANIFLNDVFVGMSPYRSLPLPEGQYTLRIQKYLFKDFEKTVTLGGGRTDSSIVVMKNNSGRITIHAPNSEIFLDDNLVGKDLYSQVVIAGIHLLNIKRSYQYIPVEQKFDLAVDQNYSTDINLKPRMGSMSVIVETKNADDADVFIDDSLKGKAPLIIPIIIGPHKVVVNKSYFQSVEKSITVRENENTKVKFRLFTKEEVRAQNIGSWNQWRWISTAVGILAIGATVYFDHEAAKNYSSYSAAGTSSEASHFRTLTNHNNTYFSLSLGITATAAAGALFSWLEETTQ
jgi:hypothetical protein